MDTKLFLFKNFEHEIKIYCQVAFGRNLMRSIWDSQQRKATTPSTDTIFFLAANFRLQSPFHRSSVNHLIKSSVKPVIKTKWDHSFLKRLKNECTRHNITVMNLLYLLLFSSQNKCFVFILFSFFILLEEVKEFFFLSPYAYYYHHLIYFF